MSDTRQHRDCTCPHCDLQRLRTLEGLRQRVEGFVGSYREDMLAALDRQREGVEQRLKEAAVASEAHKNRTGIQ